MWQPQRLTQQARSPIRNAGFREVLACLESKLVRGQIVPESAGDDVRHAPAGERFLRFLVGRALRGILGRPTRDATSSPARAPAASQDSFQGLIATTSLRRHGHNQVYGVTSHEVVLPSAVEVIEPVPGRPGAVATEAVMTLTSCNPRYSAAQRYVVHAALSASYTRAEGLPATVLATPKGG